MPANSAGTVAKYLATSFAIEKVLRRPGHEQLLADLDDLDQLRGIAVQVDHVPDFRGRLGAGVHREPDVGAEGSSMKAPLPPGLGDDVNVSRAARGGPERRPCT